MDRGSYFLFLQEQIKYIIIFLLLQRYQKAEDNAAFIF
jgi:hypothetical protein